jgi:L-malate glycosyltransferase
VGGIAEIITEQNGLLVNNGDVEGLSNAMRDMIKDYEFYDRKKIAEQATFAFNYSNIGRQINEVYNSI